MSVYVTGASGNIGRRVVHALLERGSEVTALVRDTDGRIDAANVLSDPRVRLVYGDLRDPDGLRGTADGCTSMFILTPHSPDQVELQNAAVDLATRAGAHVVKLSSWGPAVRADSPVPGARRHWAIQQYIVRRGLPHTFLCPNYFMQVLIARYSGRVRRDQLLVSPAGERGISMVDADDVAEAAARVLTEPGHDGRTYTLSGPAALTYRQIAGMLSELTGTAITYRDLPADEFAAWMVQENRKQWETDHAAAIFGQYRQGVGELITDDVPKLTGHPARDIRSFLTANIAHFIPDPAVMQEAR